MDLLTQHFSMTDPFLIIFGVTYLVAGLSFLITPHTWDAYLQRFQSDATFVLSLGLAVLPVGLTILGFFDYTASGISGLVLWILGWIIVVKGAMMVIAPNIIQYLSTQKGLDFPLWLRGIIGVALGLLLLVF